MSELGNKIHNLRGKLTLEEFAKKVGVSFSTIANIEKGKAVRKDIILSIAKSLRLPDEDTSELLIAWVRHKLGDDAHRLWIDPKRKSDKLKDSESLEAQLITKIRNLPVRFQQEILKAIDRPEVLKGIENLNELHDRISKNHK